MRIGALPWARAIAGAARLVASSVRLVSVMYSRLPVSVSGAGADRILSQPVLAFDLVHGQAADAGQRAAAVGHDHGDDDLIAAGGVGHADFHGVEGAADEGGVLVTQRHAAGGSH